MRASTCRFPIAAFLHPPQSAIVREALVPDILPRTRSPLFLVLLLLAGCTGPSVERVTPLRPDLAVMHRDVSTDSPEAQQYFDQGLVLYYGFNHDAAIASFRQAAAFDPECAMAYWGQAISAGPNINNTFMDSAAARLAWENVRKAQELAPRTTPAEQALIRALTARYAWPRPEDRRALDVAYADSMRTVSSPSLAA